MALQDYKADMERCSRCSSCKFIPFPQIKSWRFSQGCPSAAYNNFHSYSASGRMATGLSLLEGRSTCTDAVMDVVYKCLMDGSCDVSCKVCRYNMEPLETMRELRFKLVEEGQVLPQHMQVIDNLRKEDNMMLKPKAERGNWAEGLGLKNVTVDQADYVFHTGCRFSYDEELWKVPQAAMALFRKAGIDIGIMGKDENCCGGRAFDMGYRGEFTKYAENNIEGWTAAGVKTIVTSCSDCFHAFRRLYPQFGSKFTVIHTVEFIYRLIREGKIRLSRPVPLTVTYHDPCHLGRRGEPYIAWEGQERKVRGQIVTYQPRKPRYTGAGGVYDPPRQILMSIPGLRLVEMERNREFAWCCGSGGGVKEAYPDFSLWTAGERIEEAKATGAGALVTACGWCERNLSDAAKNNGALKIYDIIELVKEAME